MQSLSFRLDVSSEEAWKYYRGEATAVYAYTDDGKRVQFPAMHLRRFINHDGSIRGRFEIRFDNNNKLIDIIRISD